jgi:hypothetical protein
MKFNAMEAEDLNLALQIQKEINKITGLHLERVDVTTNGKPLENITVIKMVEIKKEEEDETT